MTLLSLKPFTANLIFLLLIFFLLQGCTNKELLPKIPYHLPNSQEIFNSGPIAYDDYKLMTGDILEFQFFYNPELNGKVEIRPDGKISIPLAEEIFAQGLTVKKLDKILTEKYTKELKNPEITVIVRKFNQRTYFISGEVEITGEKPFKDNTTILHVLASAGGIKNSGNETNILLIRSDANNKPIFVIIDYDELLTNPHDNFYLRPYDVIFVSRTLIADIGVFVEQYVNNIIPESVGFSFLYGIGGGAAALF